MTRPEHCETLELCEGCYEAVTRVGSLCVVCAEDEAREIQRAEEVAALRARAESAERDAERLRQSRDQLLRNNADLERRLEAAKYELDCLRMRGDREAK
jgi:hypothetical protein